MKVCIAVPIKTINKRLPGKTFKLLAGKPLYSYLFDTLSRSKKEGIVDEIFIDSSDDEVLKIAEGYGFKTFKRPEEFNADSVAGDQLISRIIPDLKDFDLIGWFHITSPFLSQKNIIDAIQLMKSDPNLDSVFGVVPRYNRFWYKSEPVNHDPENLVRTQDLIPVEEEADFYLFKRNSFEKYKRRVCGNHGIVRATDVESVDIDTLEDFLFAETLIRAGVVNKS